MLDFRRITLFCLEKRFSKHKMTIYSKHLGGHGPFCPPGYAYAGRGVTRGEWATQLPGRRMLPWGGWRKVPKIMSQVLF